MKNLATRKDAIGGLLMLALGAGTALHAQSYNIGTLRRMGPGFFPTILGILLALIGATMVLTSWRTQSGPATRRPEWRGWFCIVAGIIAFCVLGTYTGLAPATFAIVFISALGDRDNTILSAALLAATMVVACIIVFWWLLQLQFPLIHWG
jgi:hypothetical protein